MGQGTADREQGGRELAAAWRQGPWDRERGTGNWGTGAANWGQGTGNLGQGTGGRDLKESISWQVQGMVREVQISWRGGGVGGGEG